MKQRFINTADGLRIAVYEGGNPEGRPVLFVHGFSQSALCWRDMFRSAVLTERFRLAAYDIRGHGASDKPDDPARYAEDTIFADEIRAVMTALELHRPIVVAWSYAGRLVSDYVSTYGTSNITGINYVSARTSNDPVHYGPGTESIAAMIGDDAAAAATATRAFVRDCFAIEPSQALLAAIYAYNMLVSPRIRRYHIRRPPSDGAILARLDVPVLVTQGSEDRLVLRTQGEWTTESIRGAELSLYEGIGHTPFVESRARFERELAGFVRRAGAVNR